MSATGRTDQRGFTLIEMLVVLAVLGLVSGLAFPAVEQSIGHQQFRLAVGEIEAALHESRATAIAKGMRTSFALQVAANGVAVDLPRGGLNFYPDGSASGGTVAVSAGPRRVRFAVDAATGQIRREP